jgi:hypothetical protein
VVLNVTVTGTSGGSYLTVWPAGVARPTASNLNWTTGQTVANRVIVPVGSSGQVSFYNFSGSADVVVDVGGWFTDSSNASATGAQYVALSPARICDTRAARSGVSANQCDHNGSAPGTLGPGGDGHRTGDGRGRGAQRGRGRGGQHHRRRYDQRQLPHRVARRHHPA